MWGTSDINTIKEVFSRGRAVKSTNAGTIKSSKSFKDGKKGKRYDFSRTRQSDSNKNNYQLQWEKRNKKTI